MATKNNQLKLGVVIVVFVCFLLFHLKFKGFFVEFSQYLGSEYFLLFFHFGLWNLLLICILIFLMYSSIHFPILPEELFSIGNFNSLTSLIFFGLLGAVYVLQLLFFINW